MATAFRAVLADLWSAFGEQPPELSSETSIDFNLEDLKLRIDECDDERGLLVQAEIGKLPMEPTERAREVKSILVDNLDSIASGRICVHVVGSDEAPMVVASGIHRYEERLTELTRLLDDILDVWRRRSDRRRGTPEARSLYSRALERDDVVFLP